MFSINEISDINTMEDISASVLELVPRFNTASDVLVLGMPYIVRNIETGTTVIATMTSKSTDALTFNSWKGCFTIDAKTYYKGDTWKIYSANINDNPQIITQNIGEVVQDPINEENCPPTGTITVVRVIDYKNQKFDECLTTGIENFYKVDTESGVTVIKQFLYKVDVVENSEEYYVEYSILLPSSESDKKRYMDNGWKIHPMFYNKDNVCYENSVVLSERHIMDFTHREEDSITIQILSGLQLLYLIEFGLNQNPNLSGSMYAGIQYEDGFIVISNAYADEKNQLVIDDEIQSILVYSDYGYISRFMYDENYDWLFLPAETTDNPTLTDSYFAGPTRNLKNIIKWGDDDLNAGIFRLWMYSTSTDGDEYIVPWEFGE